MRVFNLYLYVCMCMYVCNVCVSYMCTCMEMYACICMYCEYVYVCMLSAFLYIGECKCVWVSEWEWVYFWRIFVCYSCFQSSSVCLYSINFHSYTHTLILSYTHTLIHSTLIRSLLYVNRYSNCLLSCSSAWLQCVSSVASLCTRSLSGSILFRYIYVCVCMWMCVCLFACMHVYIHCRY